MNKLLSAALFGFLSTGFFTTEASAQSKQVEYTVLNQDTLYSISRRTCSSVRQLMAANNLPDFNRIRPGIVLKLPSGHCYSSPEEQVENPTLSDVLNAPIIYNPEGDVKAIHYSSEDLTAEEYDKLLKEADRIRGTRSEPQSIGYVTRRIVEPVSETASEPQPEFDSGQQSTNTVLVSNTSHRVTRGDTLYNMSKRYCSSVNELMRVNNITDHSAIKLGMELYIPVDNCVDRSSSSYKPIKPQLKFTSEENKARQAWREEQKKLPKYSGGVEDFTGGDLNCSRKNSTDTGDNGLTAEDCFAEKDRRNSVYAAEADAAREARGVHTEAPSGFAAVLANKDVQNALINSGNSYYETKTEDARARQRIANDEIQRKREQNSPQGRTSRTQVPSREADTTSSTRLYAQNNSGSPSSVASAQRAYTVYVMADGGPCTVVPERKYYNSKVIKTTKIWYYTNSKKRSTSKFNSGIGYRVKGSGDNLSFSYQNGMTTIGDGHAKFCLHEITDFETPEKYSEFVSKETNSATVAEAESRMYDDLAKDYVVHKSLRTACEALSTWSNYNRNAHCTGRLD